MLLSPEFDLGNESILETLTPVDKLGKASFIAHTLSTTVDTIDEPSDFQFNDKVRLSKHNKMKNYIESQVKLPFKSKPAHVDSPTNIMRS